MKTKYWIAVVPVIALTYCGNKTLQKEPQRELIPAHDTPPAIQDKVSEDSLDFTEDYLLGRFEPAKHPDFVPIAQAYTTKQGVYLRKDAYEAFVRMHDAAKKDGITLKIISATRNFSSQKGIWEAKWRGERIVEGKNLAAEVKDTVERAKMILRFSSMPGTSRHHWGTDIDINDLNDHYFLSGQGKKEYEWLVANASSFGFCQPYSPKGESRPYGYEEEKWHWTYYPVSRILTRQYQEKISLDKIRGFAGAGTAGGIDVIQKYVLGINQECLK